MEGNLTQASMIDIEEDHFPLANEGESEQEKLERFKKESAMSLACLCLC